MTNFSNNDFSCNKNKRETSVMPTRMQSTFQDKEYAQQIQEETKKVLEENIQEKEFPDKEIRNQ
jgi:hypothetical protein